MSASVALKIGAFATSLLGGESFRVGETLLTTAGITKKHDVLLNVPGATLATAVTLWDSSASALSTFLLGFIVIDPDAVRSDDQDIDIRLTINGVTHLQRHDKNSPIILGPSAQGTGAITKIEALNIAGTVAVTNDVLVRCALLA